MSNTKYIHRTTDALASDVLEAQAQLANAYAQMKSAYAVLKVLPEFKHYKRKCRSFKYYQRKHENMVKVLMNRSV